MRTLVVLAVMLFSGQSFAQQRRATIDLPSDDLRLLFDEETVALLDVAGEVLPPAHYSGPGWLTLTDEFLILDVPGFVPVAFRLPDPQSKNIDITGELQFDYDEDAALLTVRIVGAPGRRDDEVDANVGVVFQARFVVLESDNDPDPVPLGDANCPGGSCHCTADSGGSADACCPEGRRPVCDCRPCCSGRCVVVARRYQLDAPMQQHE